MIYRTAHRAIYRNINENLGLLSYRIAQLTNQAASEKRINTPSDDPSGAARVLGTRSTLSAITQYRTNVAVSDLWLAESGSAVQSIKETLDHIYTLTEQAATDTYSPAQREAILTEIEGWFQQLLQNGNSKIGDSYIFAGQKVTTQSFAAQVEAHKVTAGCKNSTAWTGKVLNYGSTTFNNRPDLPIQSQNFLIEVVRAGGVDSRWFSTPSKLAGATITGGTFNTINQCKFGPEFGPVGSPMEWLPYSLSLKTTDKRYNDYQVQFVAGTANQTTTGSVARDNGISYSAGTLAYVLSSLYDYDGPVTVNYVFGETIDEARLAAYKAAYEEVWARDWAITSTMFSAQVYYGALNGSPPLSMTSAIAVAYDRAMNTDSDFPLPRFSAQVYWDALSSDPPVSLGSAIARAYINSAANLFCPIAFEENYHAYRDIPLAIDCAHRTAIDYWARMSAAAAAAAVTGAARAYYDSGVITVELMTDGGRPLMPLDSALEAVAAYYHSGVVTNGFLTAGERAPASITSAVGVLKALGEMASAASWTSVESAWSCLPWGKGWIRPEANDGEPPRTANIADISYLFKLTCSPPNDGLGLVGPGSITFNDTEVRAEVKNGMVTVYLPRANTVDGKGDFIATTADVAAALSKIKDPDKGNFIFTAEALTGSNLIFQPSATWTPLATNEPYTLAHATLSPRGTQNDLVWAVRNNDNKYVGEAGNQLSVQYIVPTDPMDMHPEPRVVFNETTGLVTVFAGADRDVYHQTFQKVFYETGGNNITAHEKAIAAAITTTARDVQAAINGNPAYAAGFTVVRDGEKQPDGTIPKITVSTGAAAQKHISNIFDVSLADGNSGDGALNFAHPRTYLTDGHDQPALFRVSQDGGLTWGPPQSFGASEYQTGDMFHNAFLGHASLTTNIPGQANDLVFTARYQGTWGNDLRVEYQMPHPTCHPNPATTVTVGPNPWNICVTLRTDAQGRVLSTAKEVMEAVNNHPMASQFVLADLANYHEGGNGVVDMMKCQSLSVGEPYQVNGKTVITPLGYATANVSFPYSAPTQSDPNIIYQAIAQGADGNRLGIRYTTSADPTHYASTAVANESFQDKTTVRYETDPRTGQTVLVVHLASQSLPSCPDEAEDPAAAAGWREAFPLYTCTETRAVTATAGDVLKAVIDFNTAYPDQAMVWPQFERHPEGWDSTAKVGPTKGTIWLTGGENPDSAEQHGVNLRFIPDGTALQVGDVFRVPVGWYRGDEKNMDVNLDSSTRGTLNTTGSSLLGGNGANDNILDTIQRLMFALKKNDTEAIGRELPHIRAAIEKVTTL